MPNWIHKFARLCRHRWAEGQVHRAFPPAVLQRLEQAITTSESLHSGKMVLCVEGGLPYSYIWRGATARERAIRLFGKLGAWDTANNNGVLIYLLMAEHAIEIVADRGWVALVPESTWHTLTHDMRQSFQDGAFAPGLEAALARVTDLLITHFPPTASHAGDKHNHLPDAPVLQPRFAKD